MCGQPRRDTAPPQLGRARRPPRRHSRTSGAPSPWPRPRRRGSSTPVQPERLRDRLLGAEARGQVHAPAAPARPRTARSRVGEQPLAPAVGAARARAPSARSRAGRSRRRPWRHLGGLDPLGYSTVTVFARLRGWSTFRPRSARDVVRQQLQRDRPPGSAGAASRCAGTQTTSSACSATLVGALGGDRDHVRAARLHLGDVREHLVEHRAVGGDAHDRRRLVEQRDRPVLHLAGRVGVGRDVGDLLQLQRALERDRQADVAAEVEEEVGVRPVLPAICSTCSSTSVEQRRRSRAAVACSSPISARAARRGRACRAPRPASARAGTSPRPARRTSSSRRRRSRGRRACTARRPRRAWPGCP